MIKPLLIALSMYSKIPVPKTEWTDDGMKYALCFFPVVGLVEGTFLSFSGICCNGWSLERSFRPQS